MTSNSAATLSAPKTNPLPTPAIGHNKPTGPVDLDRANFPDKREGGLPCTVDNVRYMLAQNSIRVRYDVVKKRTEIDVPWVTGTTENADSVAMTHIISMAAYYGLNTGMIPSIVEAIGEENSYNPIKDWIDSKPWDGTSRLPDICNTITPREGYPPTLRDTLITKWLLSAAAAAIMPGGFRSRGVLTLQGAQSLGKTAWGTKLIDDPVMRARFIKVDHHIDGSKDSQLGAIDHWIVEIGELESSFRRDVSRLKGFLTSGADKIRRPYGRIAVEYPRRTIFYATVNASDFLIDPTGNARWWTIPCAHIDHQHRIDTQQLWAELADMINKGAQWWLTADEEKELEKYNSQHRTFSLVRDRLTALIDTEAAPTPNLKAHTATEILEQAGFSYISNPQAKECASYLREWFGDPKRINGLYKWRVPMRKFADPAASESEPAKSKTKFD